MNVCQSVQKSILWHYNNLTKNHQSHLIFIIQRYDVDAFEIYSDKDFVYAKTLWDAITKGLQVHVYKVKWVPAVGCYMWTSVPLKWNN